MNYFSICLMITLLFGCINLHADDAWDLQYKYDVPHSANLRAFGTVSEKNRVYVNESGIKVCVTEFYCENKSKASTLAGKFLADLGLSEGVSNMELKLDGISVPAKKTSAGLIFVACTDGATARIISSDNLKLISSFLNAKSDLAVGAVIKSAYPTFLDRFDRYGWGMYGLGDFTNLHGWMNKCEPKDERKDPMKDLDFLVKHKIRFEPWLDPTEFDNSDGIIKNSGSDWMTKAANDKGLPVSCRLYGDTGTCDWTIRRFPGFVDQPAKFMMCGWHGSRAYWKGKPHMSWYSDYYHYMTVNTMKKMRRFNDNPMVMGWMYPAGELEHDPWYEEHADYSSAARKSWRNYLQQNRISLKLLSEMYQRSDLHFTDWAQVPVPEYATFAGLPGRIKSLAGDWYYRTEATPGEGTKGEWWKTGVAQGNWNFISNIPGNDKIYDIFKNLRETKNSQNQPNKAAKLRPWFQRDFTLPPKLLSSNKEIYLYWFPITHQRVIAKKKYNQVFINGVKAGDIGKWGALEVKKLLRPGTNRITLMLSSFLWNGRIFLSTEKPSIYPYLGRDRNRLWCLWKAWMKDVKLDKTKVVLDGMRQVDPERPIKFMAPIKMGTERWLKVCADYGSWGHFTGEGIWFFPWYKRYGFLYGLPGTSETAGPANNLNDQFNSFRRIFLAGLNGHDAVFMAQTYTRDPDLRKFWIEHDPVLKRLGRFDLAGPQVLIFRSSLETVINNPLKPYPTLGKATREIQTPWDWDIGRGTLQTLGYSYLYLDDLGVKDGKMSGYPVMFDCGDETMDPKSIAGIKEWVAAGGTFITLPFTGRNSTLEPDSWPIRQLTGCEIGKMRKPGVGSVVIGKDQSLLTKFAGKSFPDNGVSIDWLGYNHNLLSVELIPGKDCEVIASYENGKPAIVRRKLGKGSVIVLGSAFWRNAKDTMGLWFPHGIETEFITDLLSGLGFPQPSCESDDKLVWAQPYRSVNGLNFVSVLVSWYDKDDKKVNLTLRLPKKPKTITSYGVDGIKTLPFKWTLPKTAGRKGVATVEISMPAKEVKVVTADVYDNSSVVDHWWNRQIRYWQPVVPAMVDFKPYTEGKYKDPTLPLRFDAKLSTAKPASTWEKPGFDDLSWKPCVMSILNVYGAIPNKPVWVRKTFNLPQDWSNEGGRVYLVTANWLRGSPYEGKARLTLNGKVLHDFNDKKSYYDGYDITKQVIEGENVVGLEFDGSAKYQGVVGDIYLYHWTPPAKSVSLAGVWDAEADTNSSEGIKLPGKGNAKILRRTIFIPEEWKSLYNVRLHIVGGDNHIVGGKINNKIAIRHYSGYGNITDLDITNYLEFEKENNIELKVNGNGFDIRNIRLDLHINR